MFNLGSLLQNVGNSIGSLLGLAHPHPAQADYTSNINPGVISPVSPGETMTPGLASYYDREQRLGGLPQQVQPTMAPQRQVIQASQPMQQYTGSPASLQGVNPAIAKSLMDLLMNHIFPVTDTYHLPHGLVAGQAAQESGYGAKPAALNNYFGLKAHSYPGFAHFDTPEQGAKYYAQTIQSLDPNLSSQNSPLDILKAIQGHGNTGNYEGDNADPSQYVYDVTHNSAWVPYGGGAQYPVNPWNKTHQQ